MLSWLLEQGEDDATAAARSMMDKMVENGVADEYLFKKSQTRFRNSHQLRPQFRWNICATSIFFHLDGILVEDLQCVFDNIIIFMNFSTNATAWSSMQQSNEMSFLSICLIWVCCGDFIDFAGPIYGVPYSLLLGTRMFKLFTRKILSTDMHNPFL